MKPEGKPSLRLSAFVLLSCLLGCGKYNLMQTELYPAIPPNLKIAALNSVALDAKCSTPGGMTDGGVALSNGAHYQGCYFPDENAIYYDPFNPCIRHELCHASGRTPKDCAQVVCEK
jgi:hypothetical protein